MGAREAALRWWARWRKPPRPIPSCPADLAQLARMEAALVAMPELTREIFMMRRFDNLPYHRIARGLGTTTDQVETHLAGTIKTLGRAARGEEV